MPQHQNAVKQMINFNDPRETFLALTKKTYPMGHEAELLPLLPELEEDGHGNYYKIIGTNPSTMFTSHLDTADDFQQNVVHTFYMEDGEEYVSTDGSSLLGADDKAGVTIKLYMMEKEVPGVYYFFFGEEVGRIGSLLVSENYSKFDFLKPITKCISFDRRNKTSVITMQRREECCSDEFATALCDELGKAGLPFEHDPTGSYTDSASFMPIIPECTNLSVGYQRAHSVREAQNLSFLASLCEAVVKVDWEGLPVVRDPQE